MKYFHIVFFIFQETESQKTNNGIHYRLQLLYTNGKFFIILVFYSTRYVYVLIFYVRVPDWNQKVMV